MTLWDPSGTCKNHEHLASHRALALPCPFPSCEIKTSVCITWMASIEVARLPVSSLAQIAAWPSALRSDSLVIEVAVDQVADRLHDAGKGAHARAHTIRIQLRRSPSWPQYSGSVQYLLAVFGFGTVLCTCSRNHMFLYVHLRYHAREHVSTVARSSKTSFHIIIRVTSGLVGELGVW